MNKKILDNILFPSDKLSRGISAVCILIGFYLGFMAGVCNTNADAELLRSVSEFSLTLILAIIVLGISVFQFQTECEHDTEKKKEYAIKYIFGMFVPIAVSILVFLISIVCIQEYWKNFIKICITIIVLVSLNSISSTLKYFVVIFDIKD